MQVTDYFLNSKDICAFDYGVEYIQKRFNGLIQADNVFKCTDTSHANLRFMISLMRYLEYVKLCNS